MNSRRLHFILLGALGLLCIGLIGGVYGTNKMLGRRADTLVGLKAKDQALSQEQTILSKAKKDINTYGDLDEIARAVVPQDKNQAEAVQEIVNIAAANGVTLASINFPASTLGQSPSSSTGSSSGAATPPPAATSANSKANSLSQLTPVKNIPGVYQLPITITSNPNRPVVYDKLIGFLSDLEHNRRTAQVQSIAIQPSASNPNLLTFNLTLNEYIKP